MEFNPYSIPLIISFAAILTIGLLAWRHNPSSPINKAFLYYCLSLCYWLFNFSLMYNCKNEGPLAGSLAYEIRNPLTAINTFTEHISAKKSDPVFLEQFAKTVPCEINRINSLTQELLTFSKPSPPKLEKTNPSILIKSITLLLQEQCRRQEIDIRESFQPKEQAIEADPNQLKQALLNILLNAINAMPNGGTLTISTCTNKTISYPNTSVRNPEHYTIEISDTSCGINPKDLPHIFEPFFTKKEKGTGLGLPITQGIIEKHGGKIRVESELTKGTKFTISLPLTTYAS